MKKLRSAFSLLELSLVLVIVALLIGGILGGRSLIRAAELRSVITDVNAYISATNSFRDQYRSLPGDMLTAENYWPATTKGNGDGQIATTERYRFWEQLSLSGLVEKKFSGTQGAGGASDFVFDPNVSGGPNIPNSRLKGAGFSAYYADFSTSTGSTYAVSSIGNIFTFGASAGSNNGPPINAILTPTDAAVIDAKADDGVPGNGKWIANLTGPAGTADTDYNFGGTKSCSTDASGSVYTGSYQRTTNDISCSFFIRSGY